MPKIIRLVSQDVDGLFDNNFTEDIVVKPYSKIALHSLCAEINIEQIVIDAQNDEIQFKMVNSNPSFKILNIAHGVYNTSNYLMLFNDITTKMNKLMNYVTGEIGYQWSVGTKIDSKKVTFDINPGTFIQPMPEPVSTLFGYTQLKYVTSNGGSWCRSAGAAPTQDAFMYFKTTNCKGSSTLRGRIYQNGGFNNGFIIGYTTKPYSATTTIVNVADIKYGVRCVRIGDPYKTILNGVESPNTAVIATADGPGNVNNDYLSIDISNGNVAIRVTREIGTTNILQLQGAYNHIDDLFPVIVFLGDDRCRLSAITFSSDPFYNITNTISNDTTIGLGALPPNGAGTPSIRQLTFTDLDLARYLGFKQSTYLSPQTNTAYSFVSGVAFSPADFSDSFVVELQNINIESYDGLTQKRRNLLHTIVQADVIRNRLTYTAPYPLYLNINNPNEINLRRIQCRLLREDLSATSLTGYSQITMIIDN